MRARQVVDRRVTVLARLLGRIAAGHHSTRDFSASPRDALEPYVLHFPIYRTYLLPPAPPTQIGPDYRTLNRHAGTPRSVDGIFDSLRDALTMDRYTWLARSQRAAGTAIRGKCSN